jgi:hypothetical protein
MTLHTIEPERATLHGQFSRDLKPALTVDSGDTVSYRTLDVAWGLENHKEGNLPRRKFEPREPPRDDGPCLVGPVAVREAEPGAVLEVHHVEAVVPNVWGWTLFWRKRLLQHRPKPVARRSRRASEHNAVAARSTGGSGNEPPRALRPVAPVSGYHRAMKPQRQS